MIFAVNQNKPTGEKVVLSVPQLMFNGFVGKTHQQRVIESIESHKNRINAMILKTIDNDREHAYWLEALTYTTLALEGARMGDKLVLDRYTFS